MSKLFEKIECIATHHRTSMPRNLDIHTSADISLMSTNDALETMRFMVRIGTDVRIPESKGHEGYRQAKAFAQQQAIRYMQQWVFGEFMELIEEARHAAFNYDWEGALQAIDNLQRLMTHND